MAERIPQSVTIKVPLKAYLSSDHVSPATGKTIAVVLSKNGGAFGNPSAGATNATEIANGWYAVDLSTTDTGTQGPLIVRGTASGVDDVELVYTVANAHHAGFDALPNAAAEAAGGLFTRGTGAGQVNQDVDGRLDTRWVAGGVTVTTNNDKTGYSLAADQAVNVTKWLGTAPPTPNTAGVPIVDTRGVLRVGTAQGGGFNYITLDSGASSTDGAYARRRVYILSGTGAGGSGLIVLYTGSTKRATIIGDTVGFWQFGTPDNTSVFLIAENAEADVRSWRSVQVASLITPPGVSDGWYVPVDVESFGGATSANRVTSTVDGFGNGLPNVNPASIADAVWDEPRADHEDAGSFGQTVADIWNWVDTPAAIAVAVWDRLVADLTTAGSIGKLLKDNVDAAISSRSSHAAADVWTVGTRTLTAFSFAVDISSAAVTLVWDKATSSLTTAGSIGKLLVDNINATISSRLAASGYTAPDNASVAAIKTKTDQLAFTNTGKVDAAVLAAGDFAQEAADKVWASAVRTLTSFGTLPADVWTAVTRTLTSGAGIVLAKGTGLTGLNDVSTAEVKAQADDALSDVGLTTTVTGRIDVATSSRLSSADIAPLLADVGQLLTDVASIPTATENRDAVFAQVVADAITFLELSRLQLAEAGGKVDGSTAGVHTEHIRNVGDSKNVVTAVVDDNGNRTSVALDLS
jgi:hypothetical protein